ncbi:hypothetical protein BDA96_06G040300 [Sorghum bicolor]|uniref:Lipase n=2 Tax=Sorghum bicolor TaxID=4558 RepID=A0A921QNH0_SORBI|nr:triacylglycerol lipase 2 [Sorghum bicolor]EES10556.1 hypothetical protein SORBI_3006G037500 [Sorghum bicolor]KAG0525254.1 hypothetical protein BDA96_06G040300 [Sorghum bicolor]|eukprot:XP_002446228.1 triacylglycerol lipase 2 [Sorghum bicolor]
MMLGGRHSSALASFLATLLSLGAAMAARPAPLATRPAGNGTCQSRVESFGYKCEEHTVTTADGYILSLQRIPGGRGSGQSPAAGTKIPVLLQHGLLMDGVTWLMNSPNESLGYILADGGYDVWIANTRGTVYSRGHTTLSSSDPAYWDWSWDELASNDVSAVVQYVYAQSGQQRLHYVGHSLGTLIAFAALSQHQQLGMLRSAGLLSPIAYLNKVASPLALAGADTFLAEALYWLGLDEFDPTGEHVHKLVTDLCSQPGINCYNMMSVFTGDNCCLDNSSVQVFLAHEPQASATKNMVHLAQMIRRGTLAKYDYGNAADNTKHYGQATPPAYDVSAIPDDFPLFLSYGGRDTLSDQQDVSHLLQVLKSHDGDKLTVQYLEDYAHADFVFAGNARERVYAPLMAFFKLQDK